MICFFIALVLSSAGCIVLLLILGEECDYYEETYYYEELVKKTDFMDAEIEELNNRIKDRNKKIADNKELQNAIIAYSKGTDDPEKRKWAQGVFNKIPDGKIPKMTDLRREYGELIEANKPDFQQYVQLRKDYLIARKNLELLLQREDAEKQEKAKATPSKSSRSETSL